MGDGVYCSTPSKQYVSSAHPTGGHVTRLEHHRRGRHVLLGADVDQQVQTNLTKLLGVLSTVPLLWRLHVCIQKNTEVGYMSSKEAGQSRSCNSMGVVMRKATKTAKKLPPNSEEL